MKEKQKRKSILGIWKIILFLILIVVIISIFAYAKYIEVKNGEATANVAQFYFKVNDKSMQDTGNVVFASTRDDSNEKVADNMLAPGTYGHIPIKIETTGSETYIEYTINIDLENKPTNLKFYYDSNKKKEIYIKDNKIIREGFFSWNDESKIRYENIYWDWALENGNTPKQIENNDLEDSKFMNTIMTMDIVVKGRQVQQKPRYLAQEEELKVGDYVNYKASTGTASYTELDCANIDGINISRSFNSTDYASNEEEGTAWRVLSIDKENGIVELMLGDLLTPQITLGGTQYKDGISAYQNVDIELNKMGAVYGNGNGAVGGRALNINDIMQYSNFNPAEQNINNNSNTGKLGGYKIYESGIFATGEKYKEHLVVSGGVDDGDGTVTATSSNPVTVLLTYFNLPDRTSMLNSFLEKDVDSGEYIYNTIFKYQNNNYKHKWIASKCVDLYSDSCGFNIYLMNNGSFGRF